MLVEVRFDDLVEHAARTTGQGNAEQSGESGLPVDQGVGGEYFADGGGEDQQGDDPGFGQDPEVMEKEAGAKRVSAPDQDNGQGHEQYHALVKGDHDAGVFGFEADGVKK